MLNKTKKGHLQAMPTNAQHSFKSHASILLELRHALPQLAVASDVFHPICRPPSHVFLELAQVDGLPQHHHDLVPRLA
ncbi:hypothetical protein [Pseudodesulfovibrio nedwellii]|uniref:hypothetical protein n=1 Tax=Pseudodesulfovibrio nedwellii TaxID=2973072 RepID=UPI0024934CEE|nr:hypothetical protein [Pseudodesulfovibrio nedwellii]